jgi:hypothetical protein
VKSKLLLCLLVAVGVSGCASKSTTEDYTANSPVYKLKNYTGPEAMQNTEVVQASKQCIFAKLRPNVHYLNVRTDQGRVMVPVNVTCETY